MSIKKNNKKATFIFDQESDIPVFLIGDFNNWDTSADPMEKKDGKWQITKELESGAYQFKYMIMGTEQETWYNDWRADAYVKSPFGGENSVIIIE